MRQVSPHVSKQCFGTARPPGAPNTNGWPPAIAGSVPLVKSSTELVPSAEQTASKLTNHAQRGFLQSLVPNSGYRSCYNCYQPEESSHAAARRRYDLVATDIRGQLHSRGKEASLTLPGRAHSPRLSCHSHRETARQSAACRRANRPGA